MPPADMGKGDEIDEVSKVAQDYYDSDNAFNFYRQVRACVRSLHLSVPFGTC